MKTTLENIIAIFSIIGFITSALLYYKTRVEKSYAAERDFNHIKRNLEQLSQHLNLVSEESDELRSEIREIKSIVTAFSQRLDSILIRLETQSGIFGRRNHE